jgi:hypothetical protein
MKSLIIFVLCLVIMGLLWPRLARLGLGRLPGDLHIRRAGKTAFHFPLMSSLLMTALFSLLMMVFGR